MYGCASRHPSRLVLGLACCIRRPLECGKAQCAARPASRKCSTSTPKPLAHAEQPCTFVHCCMRAVLPSASHHTLPDPPHPHPQAERPGKFILAAAMGFMVNSLAYIVIQVRTLA